MENRISHAGVPLSYRDRVRVHTLAHDASWPYRKIATTVNCSPSTAHKIAHGSTTPPKTKRGRQKLLSSEDRKHLVAIATQSAENRRKPLWEIALLCNIKASDDTLRRAFASEGFHRRVARKKPFLDESAKASRLNWCTERVHWTVEDWMRVIWTDEASFNIGGARGRIWVTRNAEEEYDEACLVPKFKKLSGLMIWGCFIGARLGPLVFWDPAWGRITAKSYSMYILPILYDFWYRNSLSPDGQFAPAAFMEDGAAAHRARLTTEWREWYGIQQWKIVWPARSLDLNPIEELWRRMKDRLFQANREGRPRTVDVTKDVIKEIWDQIAVGDELRKLVESMPRRIQAVIAAGGGHTQF